MIPTPKTDAAAFEILSDLQSGTRKVVDAEIARELERQAVLAWERHAEKDRAYGAALEERDSLKALVESLTRQPETAE